MKKRLLIIAMLIITLTSCTKKPGILTGNVFWKYNDYVGNKPDAGSEVKLYSMINKENKYETSTDVSGNFKIEEIIPGKYFLIIQSSNTTDSPKDHLDNLLIYSEDLKNLFGFDESKYKKEIDEINQLQNTYQDVLTESDANKFGGLSNQMDKYEKIERDIKDKTLNLISKFPQEFKEKLNLYTGYDKSFKFTTIEIKEGKTSNENVDFGTTYN
jgi:hypothetical protein